MQLFHFTSGDRLFAISRQGITVGAIPVTTLLDRGKIGVWLTTSQQVEGQCFDTLLGDKRFRVSVDIPDHSASLHRWEQWSQGHVTTEVRQDLVWATSDLGPSGAPDWYVYFGHVRPEWILGVFDKQAGDYIPEWSAFWPESERHPGVPYWRREAWHKKYCKAIDRAFLKKAIEIGLV